MKSLKDAKLFLFDLDGTVYHDGVLIGDAKATINQLRNNGCKIVYLTNNSSITKQAYVNRLSELRILETNDTIYSSLDCAIDFLAENRKNKRVYAIATASVKEYLLNHGIQIVDDKDALCADIILLTFDKELDYKKIIIANELLVLGKEYISTHPDAVCPTRGISIPDAGSFIEMFKSSSGRVPDIILGKPYKYMAEYLSKSLNVQLSQTVMVGDRLYTDIKFGINSGIKTVLVLSGETTKEQYEASKIKADIVLNDMNELKNLI